LSATNVTSVNVADGGTVVLINDSCTAGNRCGDGWGNYVVVKHKEDLFTLYAHLKSVNVAIGSSPTKGQEIGKMGATGDPSYPPHLHFEILTTMPDGIGAFGENGNYSTVHPATI